MALALNPRAERLLQKLPRVTVYTVIELILIALLAVQCARLFWAFLTPLGPVGAYRTLAAVPQAPTLQQLGSFDPFFRTQPGQQPAQAVVTTLNIRLFGTAENRATGRGTAIIAGPDGAQRSFTVGEEIMPGVVLTAVAFDHVTITRAGQAEQLYIDQSTGAPPGPGQPGAVPPGLGPQPGPTPPGQQPTGPIQPQQQMQPIAPPAPPPGTNQAQTLRVNQ